FLRRVLRIAQRAVGAPREPARMRLEPRMVGRALDREVERELETVRMRRLEQGLEIVEAAELGMQRGVAAFLGADCIRAADVAGQGLERVVLALAVVAPDRMDRRKV